MQITEKQKQQLIDLNDSRVNEILELGLKVGEWYIIKNEYVDCIMCYQGNYSGYGFNTSKIWGVDYAMADDVWIKATKQEITQALTDEAKRRGFKKGCTTNNSNLFNTSFDNYTLQYDVDFFYDKSLNELNFSLTNSESRTIFKDGVWAEIIDDKAELKQEIKELRNKLKSLEEKL